MKTTNKLNNFQKKSILSELRDFDIIDIIGHVESSAVIKYSFYYKHRGFIFVSEIFWAYERSNSSTPSLEDFVDYLKDKLTKEITKIDIDLFNDSIVNPSSIDLVSNSLFNFITSQLYVITNIDSEDRCISMLSYYDIQEEIKKLLSKGVCKHKTYENVFADLGLDFENLNQLILNYTEE